MGFSAGRGCAWVLLLVSGFLALGGTTPSAFAQSATRDLSAFVEPGIVFTVTITITPPGTFFAAGLEDGGPSGWTISNISDGGSWDSQNASVKWGVYTPADLPATVTYDVLPPVGDVGEHCFQGEVSFDGSFHETEGDACLPYGIPAASTWGLIAMSLLMLGAGTVVIRSGPRMGAWSTGRSEPPS